jgi:hypothetical protein
MVREGDGSRYVSIGVSLNKIIVIVIIKMISTGVEGSELESFVFLPR